MSAVVVVGAQWGDEGKGKVVDLYTPYADLVVRYAGGANAGHTLVVGGEKIILKLIPSGVLHPESQCIIGQGTVLDTEVLVREINELNQRGVTTAGRLWASERAHVVLPYHKVIDGLREQGPNPIGTTKRGIGPCYEDKAARRGVRLGDLLFAGRLRERIEVALRAWAPVAKALGGELPSTDEVLRSLEEPIKALQGYIDDTNTRVHQALAANKKVLLEGAQGTMLDIDNGTYPYVTSSSSVSGGACAGAGIGPTQISTVIGITKAYTTRVGGGPFPTELEDACGQHLRDEGAEYGSVTGRPRRCGWFDAVVLRHAVRANGLSELALTKLDVLTGLSELKIASAYTAGGKTFEIPPYCGLDNVEPVYETLPGWTEDITGCRDRNELPANAQAYLQRLEALVGCRVGIVSVGPDREQTANLSDPFGY